MLFVSLTQRMNKFELFSNSKYQFYAVKFILAIDSSICEFLPKWPQIMFIFLYARCLFIFLMPCSRGLSTSPAVQYNSVHSRTRLLAHKKREEQKISNVLFCTWIQKQHLLSAEPSVAHPAPGRRVPAPEGECHRSQNGIISSLEADTSSICSSVTTVNATLGLERVYFLWRMFSMRNSHKE